MMSVPESLVVWAVGLIISGIVSLASIIIHLLIRIQGTLVTLKTESALVQSRLATLERHEAANKEESRGLVEFLKGAARVGAGA